MRGSKTVRVKRVSCGAAVLVLIAVSWLLGSCALMKPRVPDAKPEPVAGAVHIVVVGDPHYPGKSPDRKEAVLRSISEWPDVALVAVVGDLVEDVGRPAEYEAAKAFFGSLQKPRAFIVGNHDYWYADEKNEGATRLPGTAATRAEKLDRFRAAFGMRELYYEKRLGGYRFVFLSADHLTSRHFTEISPAQLGWLRDELGRDRNVPTIVFFHAPLQGTLERYDFPDFIAKPDDVIGEILEANPQVFLWVSGHVHLSARSASYPGGDRLYAGRVRSVSVPDLNRWTIWTTSLYLHPDRVEVRTWNHRWGFWERHMDLTVLPPASVKPSRETGSPKPGMSPALQSR